MKLKSGTKPLGVWMDLARGACYYIGHELETVRFSLEAEGFDVHPVSQFDFVPEKLSNHTLVLIKSNCEPSDSDYSEIAKLRAKDAFLLAWVPEELETAWYDAGVNNVFVGDSKARFAAKIRFVGSLIDEFRKARSIAKEHAIALEDLQTTVDSLEIASRRFEALFNGLPVATFTFDSDGLVHEWNKVATELFGIESFEAFFQHVSSVLDPDGFGYWSDELVDELFNSTKTKEFDWKFVRNDGTEIFLACKVLCMTNRKGEVIAAVAGNLDITERVLAKRKVEEQVLEIKSYLKVMEKQRLKLQEANRQLRRLAVTDGLTGLMNRRRFNEQLDEVLDRAIRQDHRFSLLIFDIDHFKSLNDVFGHQAGDEILIKFAEVLRATARRYERPARYGGEEFAIVLDNCDAEAARLAAERFRTAIIMQTWPYREITVSVGSATFTGTESARGMIENADKALYYSKANGRNRSTHYNDLPADLRKVA